MASFSPGRRSRRGDRPVFELLADDPGRLEAQAVSVKPKGSLQVIDTEGQDAQ